MKQAAAKCVKAAKTELGFKLPKETPSPTKAKPKPPAAKPKAAAAAGTEDAEMEDQ